VTRLVAVHRHPTEADPVSLARPVRDTLGSSSRAIPVGVTQDTQSGFPGTARFAASLALGGQSG
jgi:hypothetical protein